MWRNFRILLLLLILASVAQQSWLNRADLDWKHNLYVAVYPVNVDQSAKVSAYLQSLTRESFEPVAAYFAKEAAPYTLGLRRPLELQLGAPVAHVPPAPPFNGSALDNMLWSLKFRYFAWRNSPTMSVKPDIRLYLLYYDPEKHTVLTHSTALSKGRIGRVNLFADDRYGKQNLVILAHELLHTINATDKYDLSTGLPRYPDGYAEPDRQPRFPQVLAELMGGRVPASETHAAIPNSLYQTVIGEKTAREIGWLK